MTSKESEAPVGISDCANLTVTASPGIKLSCGVKELGELAVTPVKVKACERVSDMAPLAPWI